MNGNALDYCRARFIKPARNDVLECTLQIDQFPWLGIRNRSVSTSEMLKRQAK
jgi:hypothetical protein